MTDSMEWFGFEDFETDGQEFQTDGDNGNESHRIANGLDELNPNDFDPTNPYWYIRKNIENFRNQQDPQLIIINTNIHWIALVLTPQKMWIADSLGSPNSPIHPIVEDVYQCFVNLPLPTLDSDRSVCESEVVRISDSESEEGEVE